MAMTSRNKPAQILVVSGDLSSLNFRSELERLKEGHFLIRLTLLSDATTAAVVSNNIESRGWKMRTVPLRPSNG